MSTRSEQFKANAERTGAAKRAAETPANKPARAGGHAEKKAAYAREAQPENGRPSRKSTRKSANRTKTDTGEVRAEQMRENTPEARFARTERSGEAR